MADTATTTYGIVKPEVGASDATWGGKYNATMDKLDDLLDGTIAIKPDLDFELWKVGGTEVTASADELNKLDGLEGDPLSNGQTDTLTKGFDATEFDAGTKSGGTFTPDPAEGNFQKAVNGGSHILAPPASTCSIVIQYTNDASAGVISTSDFTVVTGDPFTTTDGDDFMCYIVRCNGFSHLNIVALQ